MHLKRHDREGVNDIKNAMLQTTDGNNLEQYEPILVSVVGGNFNGLTNHQDTWFACKRRDARCVGRERGKITITWPTDIA